MSEEIKPPEQVNQSTPNPRIQEFLNKLKEVMDAYELDIVPGLQYTPNGVFPALSIVERKKSGEQIFKEIVNNQPNEEKNEGIN